MIDFAGQYHYGVRVPHLESAMAELSDALGVTWCSVQERPQSLWTPERGAHTVDLRFTYSQQGPCHIELLQGERGSLWDGDDRPGIHHAGIWCDDVPGETERLVAAGWTLLMAQKAPADGYGAYTYVQSPGGLILEPVWSVIRPRFEAWFAGGSLG
jgi:lactoylglutathione lyase